jgi:chromosome segregation ATPase
MRFLTTTKQKLLGKDKTVDDEFELQRTRFKRVRDALQQAHKQVKKLSGELKELAGAATSLAPHVAELYDQQRPAVGEQLKAHTNQFVVASLACGEAVAEFDDYVKAKLDKCAALATAIDKRDEALLYADAKRDALAALREKPPKDAAKLDEAEAKHEAAQAAYAELNGPLVGELELFAGISGDLEPRYRAFLQSQLRFAMSSTQAWSQMAECV